MVGETPVRAGSRVALRGAALLTVVVAVGADVVAGERAVHTLALGLVAVAVAGVRVGLGGRRRGALGAVSGVVVAQPALHAAAKLLHPSAGHDGAEHAALTGTSLTASHILIAGAIIGLVTSGEQLLLLLGSALHRMWGWRWLLAPALPYRAPAGCTVELGPSPSAQSWVGHLAGRGPPPPASLVLPSSHGPVRSCPARFLAPPLARTEVATMSPLTTAPLLGW